MLNRTFFLQLMLTCSDLMMDTIKSALAAYVAFVAASEVEDTAMDGMPFCTVDGHDVHTDCQFAV